MSQHLMEKKYLSTIKRFVMDNSIKVKEKELKLVF